MVPIPAPDPLGLPSPVWLILLLHETTQMIHFLFMNFVLGGSWFLIWLHFGRRTDWKEQLYQRCLSVLPVALSMTISFGIAPLLFVQTLYGHFFYTANVLMGGYWLGLLGVLVVAFYLIYVLKAKKDGGERFSSPGVRLFLHLAIACSFTFIALLHTANAVLTVTPDLWKPAYTGCVWKTLWTGSSLFLPRYLHNVVGALGIAGLWVLWIGNHRGSLNPSDQARSGVLLSLVASLVQTVLGFWYLAALPTDILKSIMRFDSAIGWHFLSSIGVAIFFFVGLVALTVLPCHRVLRWVTTSLGVLLVFSMVTFSGELRQALLAESFELDQWQTVPQSGPIFLFLGLFAVGLGVIGWIAWALWKGFAAEETPSGETPH